MRKLFLTVVATLVWALAGAQVIDLRVFDAGVLQLAEAPYTMNMKFTNISGEDINIMKLSANCSCLTIATDKRIYGPGEEGNIVVTYNPNGHVGNTSYLFLLYTEKGGAVPTQRIPFKAYVEQGDVLVGYPVNMGALKLKRSEVDFGSINNKSNREERILATLKGAESYSLKTVFPLPEWLSLYSEPSEIKERDEVDIVIAIDGSKVPSSMKGNSTYKVILDGLDCKPSERTLTLTFIVE